MSAITVTNLGKAYKQYPNRWSRLAEWVLPGDKVRHTVHWVLQDINFSVERGEAVGIVGINGAGKSTLLKMITGTTQPTTGNIVITGRIAALLELGMGFHPDFTGRQNAFMAGQLLGLSVGEIAKLMPEIESFADIGEYIDQPIRVYSSGMQVRLAFAVSTVSQPDVLVVDEALSVGDAAFQRKCFQRLEKYRATGVTLLFVSHDVETVKKICDRALYIKDGHLAKFGAAKSVCDEYEKDLFGGRSERLKSGEDQLATVPEVAKFDPSLVAGCAMAYGNGKAQILGVKIEDQYGNTINIVESGKEFNFIFDLLVNADDVRKPFVNMQLKTTDGVVIYGVNSNHLNLHELPLQYGRKTRVRISLENRLAPGTYFLNCGLKEMGSSEEEFCHRIVDAVILRVVDRARSTVARGIVDMRASLDVFFIEEIA